MRGARFLTIGLATAALAGAMAPTPAAGADSQGAYVLFQGRDKVVTSADLFTGWVCDEERDGHYVYAWWYDNFGNRLYGEKDGGDKGCDKRDLRPGFLSKVKLCESVPGRKDPCTTQTLP
jgi:hypothetical protein